MSNVRGVMLAFGAGLLLLVGSLVVWLTRGPFTMLVIVASVAFQRLVAVSCQRLQAAGRRAWPPEIGGTLAYAALTVLGVVGTIAGWSGWALVGTVNAALLVFDLLPFGGRWLPGGYLRQELPSRLSAFDRSFTLGMLWVIGACALIGMGLLQWQMLWGTALGVGLRWHDAEAEPGTVNIVFGKRPLNPAEAITVLMMCHVVSLGLFVMSRSWMGLSNFGVDPTLGF